MKRLDIATIADERPNLHMELEWRRVIEVWLLNDTPTGPEAERAGKRTWILLAKGENNNYIIQSQAGTKSTPDKFTTWVHYGDEMGQPDGFIIIDKTKVGRPPRVLTEAERQEILSRHEAGEGINRIAKAMHLGTKRITEALRHEADTRTRQQEEE